MKVFRDHCGPKGDTGADGLRGATGPAGTPGLSAIGTPITSAIANAVLFADGDGKLAQDAGFTFDTQGGARALAVVVPSGDGSAAIYCQAHGNRNAILAAQHEAGVDWVSSLTSYWVDGSTGIGDFNGDFLVAAIDGGGGISSVTIPSLAGVGTRHVVVDANGKLSAP